MKSHHCYPFRCLNSEEHFELLRKLEAHVSLACCNAHQKASGLGNYYFMHHFFHVALLTLNSEMCNSIFVLSTVGASC